MGRAPLKLWSATRSLPQQQHAQLERQVARMPSSVVVVCPQTDKRCLACADCGAGLVRVGLRDLAADTHPGPDLPRQQGQRGKRGGGAGAGEEGRLPCTLAGLSVPSPSWLPKHAKHAWCFLAQCLLCMRACCTAVPSRHMGAGAGRLAHLRLHKAARAQRSLSLSLPCPCPA